MDGTSEWSSNDTLKPASAEEVDGAPRESELTPAEAETELLQRGPELAAAGDDDEIERLAAIADQGDDEHFQGKMPDPEAWTAEERAEIIASWRAKRRWIARSAPRPDETTDEWHERLIAQMVDEHGCAPLVIPASRRQDVVECDLATLRRRDRRRLFRGGGSKSLEQARRHTLKVLRCGNTRAAPRRRPEACSRARRPAARRASGRYSGQDPPDESDPDPARPLAAVVRLPRRQALLTFGCLSAEERGEEGAP